MLLLSSLLTPELGLIFWTTLIFLLVWGFLGKMAWNPIIGALNERETKISNALNEAEKARQEMANLQSEHLKLLNEAKEERSRIIKEAKEIKESIIGEAREKAKADAAKIVTDAQVAIENQKMAAITEVKNMIGLQAISLSEQILRRELKDRKDQEAFAAEQVKKLSLR